VTNLERFALSHAFCRHCGYHHSHHGRNRFGHLRCRSGPGFFESRAEHPGAQAKPSVASALEETRKRVRGMLGE
jgi:hypothetical protein